VTVSFSFSPFFLVMKREGRLPSHIGRSVCCFFFFPSPLFRHRRLFPFPSPPRASHGRREAPDEPSVPDGTVPSLFFFGFGERERGASSPFFARDDENSNQHDPSRSPSRRSSLLLFFPFPLEQQKSDGVFDFPLPFSPQHAARGGREAFQVAVYRPLLLPLPSADKVKETPPPSLTPDTDVYAVSIKPLSPPRSKLKLPLPFFFPPLPRSRSSDLINAVIDRPLLLCKDNNAPFFFSPRTVRTMVARCPFSPQNGQQNFSFFLPVLGSKQTWSRTSSLLSSS